MTNITNITNPTSISFDIPTGLVEFIDIKLIQGLFMILSGILVVCDAIGEIFLGCTTFVLKDVLNMGMPPIWIPGLINLSILLVLAYLALNISQKVMKYFALLFIGLIIVCIVMNLLG